MKFGTAKRPHGALHPAKFHLNLSNESSLWVKTQKSPGRVNYVNIGKNINKKAVLPQGNRAMPQVFFSVEVRQQHSLQV